MKTIHTHPFIDAGKALLISAGAAMAANGNEELLTLVSTLKASGVPEAKIRRAVSIGYSVRRNATLHVTELARHHIGPVGLPSNVVPGWLKDADKSALCPKTTLLVTIAATVAAPCETCFKSVHPKINDADLATEDVLRAIEIGHETQLRIFLSSISQAGEHFETRTGNTVSAGTEPSPQNNANCCADSVPDESGNDCRCGC